MPNKPLAQERAAARQEGNLADSESTQSKYTESTTDGDPPATASETEMASGSAAGMGGRRVDPGYTMVEVGNEDQDVTDDNEDDVTIADNPIYN